MKPKEVVTRSFKLYPTTDQAATYACAAILKDSDFSEVDKAECQFTTTATSLDNGSQIPFQPPKSSASGFFESIKELWNKFWSFLSDFVTGKNCRKKCSGFFDLNCHIQYICIGWMLLFSLFLAIFPTAILLLWLLHQKGLFDPIYEWWEDHCMTPEERNRHLRKHDRDAELSLIHWQKGHHRHDKRHHHKRDPQRKRSRHLEHKHRSRIGESDDLYYAHRVHKDKHKQRRFQNSSILEQEDRAEHHHEKREKIHRRHEPR